MVPHMLARSTIWHTRLLSSDARWLSCEDVTLLISDHETSTITIIIILFLFYFSDLLFLFFSSVALRTHLHLHIYCVFILFSLNLFYFILQKLENKMYVYDIHIYFTKKKIYFHLKTLGTPQVTRASHHFWSPIAQRTKSGPARNSTGRARGGRDRARGPPTVINGYFSENSPFTPFFPI